jgi:hypothetical protein
MQQESSQQKQNYTKPPAYSPFPRASTDTTHSGKQQGQMYSMLRSCSIQHRPDARGRKTLAQQDSSQQHDPHEPYTHNRIRQTAHMRDMFQHQECSAAAVTSTG